MVLCGRQDQHDSVQVGLVGVWSRSLLASYHRGETTTGIIPSSVSDPDSCFTDPDPGLFPQSGSKQQKPIFLRQKQNFERNFCFQPKKYIFYLFSTNQVGILLNIELLFVIIFKNKWKSWKICGKSGFFSSISLSGSGFRIRIQIRIQHGNLNPDPSGSGSETLIPTYPYQRLWKR